MANRKIFALFSTIFSHPIPLLPSSKHTIGRDAENEIVLDGDLVSRRHAKISVEADGTIFLEDRGSRNGTILNGNKLSKKTLLQDQDKITIGSYHLFCRTLDSEAPLLKPQNAPEKNTTLPLRDFQDAHDLMGSFDHLRLTELLSTLEHHKKSGNLNIIHQEEEGKLYFHKGKLLRCSYQNLENFDAIFTLLRLEDGVFEFSPEDLSEESDEMQMPVSQILIRFIQGR